MIAAGVAPNSAWMYLAEEAPAELVYVLGRINDKVESHETIGEAIVGVANSARTVDQAAWRGLAAAWLVATESGAPLAPTLAEFASTLRSFAATRRELQTALAAPTATAHLVMILPAIGVVFGVALGFDVLITLFTTLPGLVCLVLGILLLLTARLWNSRLISRATPTELTPGLTLDLMAIALAGGTSLDRAHELVSQVKVQCQLSDTTSPEVIESVLRLSRRAGVPAGVLLRSEATETRRRAESEAQRKAAKLSVTLMLPLGLCILPAFMLLGVAPLVVSVIKQTITPL
jgi:tight adherence protein B